MTAMIRRNLLLYFRDRAGVFFSLLGALISFVLYLVFLKQSILTEWRAAPNANQLLDLWQIGGTMTIMGITTTLASLERMVQDRENGVRDDLLLTDAGPFGLQVSYMVSAAIIGLFMQLMVLLIMGLYFVIADGITIHWAELPMVGVIMLLSTFTATALNTMLVQGIKKIATLGAVSTVISTAAGFLVGTYVPIGALPNAAQVLLKCTPGAYIAALYRETLMGPTLMTTFQHHAAALTRFRTTMGVRIAWSSQLTVGQTYGIVGSVLLIALFFALLPQWRAARQRRALVNA